MLIFSYTDEVNEKRKAKAEERQIEIIETGKYKGKTLAECPKEYIVWASKHEKNFAERNQWISRDAKFQLLMLEREQESQKAQSSLREGKVFDSVLQDWVTPSSDDALDVARTPNGATQLSARLRTAIWPRSAMRSKTLARAATSTSHSLSCVEGVSLPSERSISA